MKKFTVDELDINYFVGLAESHVGEIHDLKFQSGSKYGQVAGKFEILAFTADDPCFTYDYWMNEENRTPDGAHLGYYTVKITESKFYNGKTVRVRVSAYVQEKGKITKALYVDNLNYDTKKSLRAYRFGILDFQVYK